LDLDLVEIIRSDMEKNFLTLLIVLITCSVLALGFTSWSNASFSDGLPRDTIRTETHIFLWETGVLEKSSVPWRE